MGEEGQAAGGSGTGTGTSEGAGASGGGEGSAEAARPNDLEGHDLEAANAHLRRRVGDLEGRLSALTSEAETARDAAGSARAEGLGHFRRALLAENHGQVVDELVAGGTTEELLASVEVARSAFGRATDEARRQLRGQIVAAGAPARGPGLGLGEGLSPVEKIAQGLRTTSR